MGELQNKALIIIVPKKKGHSSKSPLKKGIPQNHRHFPPDQRVDRQATLILSLPQNS